MIKGTMKLKEVDSTPLTITLTATVGEWRQLAKQMPQAWPGWQFADVINNGLDSVFRRLDVETEVSA